MSLKHDLDAVTSTHMLDELRDDLRRGRVFMSPWLTLDARDQLPALLEVVLTEGTDENLADVFRQPGVLERFERDERGDLTSRRVPKAAPVVLAEFLFNRYVVRGVCRRAVEDGIAKVEVYRARVARNPRPESERLVGTLVDAKDLLDDLREHADVLESTLGLAAFGSGLSVRLPVKKFGRARRPKR